MSTASGVFKTVSYKAETVYGTKPSAASAQALRRVSSSLDMTKDTYQSAEIRDDFQIADFRHGVRRVGGTINGEVSAGTYKDFFAASLKKDFVAVAAIVGVALTITAEGSPITNSYEVLRGTGSWLTDDVKEGDVIRCSVGLLDATANLGKNLLVTDIVDATHIVVIPVNGEALVPQGPISGCTVTVYGKKAWVPQTGHTDKSFSIEHWFSDVPASEVYTGCKVSRIALNLPPTGMATIGIDFTGKDAEGQATQYFTTPTAATTTGCMAAVNGVLVVGDRAAANVTGLSIDIATATSGEPVVGANTVPFQAPGRVVVTGQMTVMFSDTIMRDAFWKETEMALYAVFTASNAKDADFIGFSIPRLKVGGASKDDGEKTLILTVPFQALLNSVGGTDLATDKTTMSIQDSQA